MVRYPFDMLTALSKIEGLVEGGECEFYETAKDGL